MPKQMQLSSKQAENVHKLKTEEQDDEASSQAETENEAALNLEGANQPPAVSRSNILRLQNLVGNRAVQRMIANTLGRSAQPEEAARVSQEGGQAPVYRLALEGGTFAVERRRRRGNGGRTTPTQDPQQGDQQQGGQQQNDQQQSDQGNSPWPMMSGRPPLGAGLTIEFIIENAVPKTPGKGLQKGDVCGNRRYTNVEKTLPTSGRGGAITYTEYDTKKYTGANRGTERFIVGSDGRMWYTNDHYQSFKQFK